MSSKNRIYDIKGVKMHRKKINLSMTAGYRTTLVDGYLVAESPFHMATELFYPVSAGDFIECVDRRYIFAVATFEAKREDKYLYTYDYKRDSAWVVYRQDLTPDSYSRKSYVFKEDGYCRICVKKADGSMIEQRDADAVNDILHFYAADHNYTAKECFGQEIEDTVKKVKGIGSADKRSEDGGKGSYGQQRDLLRMCLLSDSHYTVNGTWQDTADNISKTLAGLKGLEHAGCLTVYDSKKSGVDAIVHLGDFTDGMTSKKVTSHYVENMLRDLRENEVPVYVTLGNHDSNYFRGNKQRFAKEEQNQLFGLKNEYYYVDFEKAGIRCFFLASYDADVPVRYGFSEEEIEWVTRTLDETPEGYKVLVFSHEAPLEELDYWARLIRNGKKLMEVLETYNAREGAQVLAYIHGHTHAEHVYRGSSFPIISIGCNKCEYYPDKKPKGSHAYHRQPDTVTQDLWDILVVDAEAQQLHFVRFGAGEDRTVDCHKKESTWRQLAAEKKRARKTKIWAHRGASGFAPENTMPAFEVAKALDVDGIELDVQMTKDGELVVVHDEQIDRTSDGKGWVKDYTLAQLREFNFGKLKPLYGFVTIPTLREVYELFQDTDCVINVELKTSIVPYDGSEVTECVARDRVDCGRKTGSAGPDRRCIEQKVHELTVEMGMEERVIYSSFSHPSILKMQQFVTKEQTAFLFCDGWIGVTEYAEKYQVDAVHPPLYYQDLAQMVAECHEKGMKVHVWTVNEEEHALKLKEMGVDAIITNHPGRMKKLFEG